MDVYALARHADVVVVIDYPCMDGVVTTGIDVHLNLLALGINSLLITVLPDNVNDMARLMMAMRTSTPLTVNDMHQLRAVDAAMLRCRCAVVSFGSLVVRDKFLVNADKLVVLSAGTVTTDRLQAAGRRAAYVKALAQTKQVHVLGNNCHAADFAGLDYRVYRQRFARPRLEYINNMFPAGDDVFDESVHGGAHHASALCARTLRYQRWNEVVPGVFSENIGKAIFEFRWMNRPVHYSPANRTQPDGLTEYLALFGVDDTVEQELTFTRADVDRLLVDLKPDDELVKALTK